MKNNTITKLMILRIIQYILPIFILSNVISCNNTHTHIDISDIKSNVEIHDFTREFYSEKKLSFLKNKYPFFFDKYTPDSVWLNKKKDTSEVNLAREVMRIYPKFESSKPLFDSLFRNIKYYYPKFKEPKIYSYISMLDTQNPVIYADSMTFIALDLFLGKDNKYYANMSNYIKKNYDKKHILSKTSEQITDKIVTKIIDDYSFLNEIIYLGKKKLLTSIFLPKEKIFDIMGWDEIKYNWAINNEYETWNYFMENDVLYSSDKKFKERFVNKAPFSKFYLDIDNDSPGEIGTWIGFRILKSYLENNSKTTLQSLINNKNYKEILNKSHYKPKAL